MGATIYQCPNCAGGLIFDPAKQQFVCEYCGNSFDEKILELAKKPGAEGMEQPEVKQAAQPVQEDDHTVLFSCPSCGGEVVADETTAASFCYYCHNPVVLSERLAGNFRPDKVVPFSISREQAVEGLMKWAGKKRFIPKNFFSEDQIEKVTGVYFPYWMVDSSLQGHLDTTATRVRTWRSGDTEYTETSFFRVIREGTMEFQDVSRNALNKENSKFVNGVLPYEGNVTKDYSPAYLSGFLAERRNVERQQCESAVRQEIQNYAQNLLRGSINGYTTVSGGNFSMQENSSNWKYTLLPVWTLTYRGRDGKMYYYTMNGQTGKIGGVLPVSYGRLVRFFSIISAALLAVLLFGGYLL